MILTKQEQERREEFRREKGSGQHADFLPTLEQIAAACLEIQKNWSAKERLRRLRGRGQEIFLPSPTPPPVYKSTHDIAKNVRRRRGV